MVWTSDLRAEQARVRGRCRHPTGCFTEFPVADLDGSIPARFERQARAAPGHVALHASGTALTYEELDQRASRLATVLAQSPRDGVGALAVLARCPLQQVAAALAALKLGRIVVPLDPSHPAERLQGVLQDSRAHLLVTDDAELDRAREAAGPRLPLLNASEIDVAVPAAAPGPPVHADAPAYILYTSGSTGRPKGVTQSHRNVLHWVMHYTNALHLCCEDRLTLLFGPAFVDAPRNVFSALLNGASLHPLDVRQQGLAGIHAWLAGERITVYNSVVTLFRRVAESLVHGNPLPHLRAVYLTGEPVQRHDVDLCRRWLSPQCILINGIGAAETPNFGRFFVARQTPLPDGALPVGYSTDDTQVLLLDETGSQVGDDQVGEIAVKSRYLSLGYWGQPELTDRLFVPAPAGEGLRVYRTGDLGRRRSDGCLVHLGRRDLQVKIRGARVETAEVEGALLALDGVKEAAIAAPLDASGEARLVAYFVPSSQPPPTAREMRAALQRLLPEYSVPSMYLPLEALPLSANGKVDRLALPPPRPGRQTGSEAPVPPRDDLEQRLVGVWEEVLGAGPIGVTDGFHDLGGDSLLGVRLCARIGEALDIDLTPDVLAQAPTVAQLAAWLRHDRQPRTGRSLVCLQPQGSGRPLFCLPGMIGQVQRDLGHLARYLGARQPCYGLQDSPRHPARIEPLAACFLAEVQQVQGAGPYRLAGVCFGGVVAFEMAQQLRARGHEVDLLALVDTPYQYLPGLSACADMVRFALRRLLRRHGVHGRRLARLSPAEARAYVALRLKLLANEWALRRYEPRPYPGAVHLLVTEESLRLTPQRFLCWGDMALSGSQVHVVPGSHAMVVGYDRPVEASQMRAVAEILEPCLHT